MTDLATARDRLIVALDLPSVAAAEKMVAHLGDAVSFYKIGLQLLATEGMALARDLKRDGKSLFLDWKLHDIGATVEKAAAALAETGVCDLLTVHAEPQVMKAAVRGKAGADVKILAVTVLTSLTDADLQDLGYSLGVEALVERRIRQALEAGVDGVVASPHEAAMARRIGGDGFLVVTPGVRPFYSSQIKRSGADPRLNIRYALSKEHSIKAALGQYTETPQFVDTDPNFGNPSLRFIRSYQYVLGVESNWSDLWTTDFEVYYKTIYDEVRSDLLSPALGALSLIRLTVSDTGPGIPDAIVEHIFDPFFTRRTGGTGLGLALVQRAVEAHGGAIFVDNGAAGSGTGAIFTLYLPAHPVSGAAGAGIQANEEGTPT